MGIKVPFVCEIAPKTYAINEYGLATMYLLVGQREALLIDTGCGACDLKSIIEDLTDKPYRVVITHGHFDHVGGMGNFDEVYLNVNDHELAKSINYEEVRKYADGFGKAGSYDVYDFTPENIKEIDVFPSILNLTEGNRFDLGGRVVETYDISGHTDGGVSFLDIDNRIIFSGDCCNVNLLAPNCSVERTLQAMRKFKSLSAKFDRNYNGHAGPMGMPTCMSQPDSVPDDLIHICECILNGKGSSEQFEFVGHTFTQMRFGSAKLSYDPNCLREEEEDDGQ